MQKIFRLRLPAALLIPIVSLTACSSGDSTPATSATSEAAVSSSSSSQNYNWGEHVDLSQFKDFVENNSPVIVDVRTPGEYQSGHLPGAINIDVSNSDFQKQISDLSPDKQYAIYCRSGNRSRSAQAQMVKAGLEQTLALEGGIGAWDGEIE
ncbi:MAG: rhodanese-like domain-containing protein [Actinomycetaceae bacterium]|nr:rhodanese-like domain-containing protein [Actinomycetaceae bacterium]